MLNVFISSCSVITILIFTQGIDLFIISCPIVWVTLSGLKYLYQVRLVLCGLKYLRQARLVLGGSKHLFQIRLDLGGLKYLHQARLFQFRLLGGYLCCSLLFKVGSNSLQLQLIRSCLLLKYSLNDRQIQLFTNSLLLLLRLVGQLIVKYFLVLVLLDRSIKVIISPLEPN